MRKDFFPLAAPRPVTNPLQWGRNLIVAEGCEKMCCDRIRRRLQWGRNLIVAEGGLRPRSIILATCFNGAAT